MPYLATLFAAVLLLASGGAIAEACNDANAAIQKSQEFCDDEVKGATFILVDGSDRISDSSMHWIRTRVFAEKKITHFDYGGGKILTAHLSGSSVANLPLKSFCSPLQGLRALIVQSPEETKHNHSQYRCAIGGIRSFLDRQNDEAGVTKSFLVEAIMEIFENPAYEMRDVTEGGARKFILASDLLQNSTPLRFYDECKQADGGLKCPTYDEILKRKDAAAEYLVRMTPTTLRETDEVYLFNINQGNIDQPAREFWLQYFEAAFAKAGVQNARRSHIYYFAEGDGL